MERITQKSISGLIHRLNSKLGYCKESADTKHTCGWSGAESKPPTGCFVLDGSGWGWRITRQVEGGGEDNFGPSLRTSTLETYYCLQSILATVEMIEDNLVDLYGFKTKLHLEESLP